jgi:hypothetical protein
MQAAVFGLRYPGMKYLYILPVITLAFAACDSKEENQRENALENKADAMEKQADATRKAGERKADAIEDTKPGSEKLKVNTPQDKAADATRKDAEAKADGLENKADAVRDQK